MKKISTYIFFHDKKILEDFERTGKFKNIPNLTYVFLGNGEIQNYENVIIAKNLKHNIEDFPKFTSFTGWYALWKNDLIDSEYINLFEYDIILNPDFVNIQNSILENKHDFIGYLPMGVKEPCYLIDKRWTVDMIESIRKIYNLDILSFLNNMIKENPNLIWSSTSNSTFNNETFNNYMKWFEPIMEDLKTSPFPGHAHERSISFFYFTHAVKYKIYTGLLNHFQLNSHNTSPLPNNRFELLYNKLF